MVFLFIGDIMGKPGRQAVKQLLPGLKKEFGVDLTVANGENAAGGFGITAPLVRELTDLGVDVLTTGNHVWDKRELIEAIDAEVNLLRPVNFPPGAPGRGRLVATSRAGKKAGVINAMGRVYLSQLDDPFRATRAAAAELRKETPCILVDFHAEITSEKRALGFYLDGHASLVVGTHTHVQTADEQILPGGTAYLTDVGMTGAHDSVIGIPKEQALQRFLTCMPVRFDVATGDVRLSGVVVEADDRTGRALRITRIQRPCQADAPKG